MKKVLLVYLPFCTPASPPYSITYLYSFLKQNCGHKIDVLDLNLEFHKLKFSKYQKYYQDSNNWKDYNQVTKDYQKLTTQTYSKNNRKVIKGENPEFFEEILQRIKDKKPDIVAFSIVYSSQTFYAYSLIKKLEGITTVIGGPAVNQKLMSVANKTLSNEFELLDYVKGKKEIDSDVTLDFSIYDLNEYFTPKPVIPIKTSNTCYYKRCTFCSHFSEMSYQECKLDLVKENIVSSKQKYFFLIDDAIPHKRLLKIAKTLKPLEISWTCQLRPTKEWDYQTLKKLRESGLTMIIWGVESGNDRILKLINKGTDIKNIEKVLSDSHKAGIRNILYVLFGFPTETEEELLETVNFLTKNKSNIDLISTSVFGLQRCTKIYNNPKVFGIKKILEKERTILGPKLVYEVEKGITQEQAKKLRGRYQSQIREINNFPNTMNFFREHGFFWK